MPRERSRHSLRFRGGLGKDPAQSSREIGPAAGRGSRRLFPARVHEAFVAVRRGESVVVLVRLFVGRVCLVHLRPVVFPMGRAWFDGKISGRALRLLHPLEYGERAAARRRREGREPNPYENVKS